MKWMDGHCDVLWRMWEDPNKNFYLNQTGLDVQYEYIVQANMKLQIFAVFVPPSVKVGQRSKEALKQIDLFYEQVIGHEQYMVPVTSVDKLDSLRNAQCGALLALEGADALEGDLAMLRLFHRLGVRQIGLTWNYANEVADGIQEPRGGGLTQFGRELLSEMSRLQMIVDVSHLSEAGFYDVMETTMPVVASHSNSRAICPHVRNLTDEQICLLIARDGLIGINFVPYFVAKQNATIADLCRHIEHICELGGEDHIFFGSDFDGEIQKIAGLENLSQLQHLQAELTVRYGEEIVQKWGFNNCYRFYSMHLR